MSANSNPAATCRRQLTFQAPQSPWEIAAILEADLMTIFRPNWDEGRLHYHGSMKHAAVIYMFDLLFAGALPDAHLYTLSVTADWAGLPASAHQNARHSTQTWFQFWTRRWQPASPPSPSELSAERYRAAAGQSLDAESHLSTIPAIQQAILDRMRQGAGFFTAHKEGGTHIRFRGNRFVRADYGESDRVDHYESGPDFLAFLREFYDWEISRANYPQKPSEFDAWKLILRLLKD